MEDTVSNRYSLIKSIGSGGMADVYLAFDKQMKKQVALKVLRYDLAQDPVNLTRFRNEARAIANTSHPNVVEIYDIGQDQGKHYLAMEFVNGSTLKQLVQSRGPLPCDEAVNIMKQLTSAVASVHKAGIIHRDIKTQNVLVKPDGTVKLSDFGIAYSAEATQLTQTETVLGSIHYMAPELTEGEKCTPQSDIYALGIVFYELLTGSVPFKGERAIDIAMKHLHDEIPSVRDYNSDIPQSVENIIIKATAKKKAQRYSSALEMFNDIATCLDSNRLNEQRTKTKDSTERTVKKKKEVQKQSLSISNVLLIIMACVLSLALFVLFLTLSKPEEIPPVEVPNVTGYEYDQARQILADLGFNVDGVRYESSDTFEKGQVIRLSPSSGTVLDKGSYVEVIVSEGLNYTFGNYIGQKADSVIAILEAEGFIVTTESVATSAYEPGFVIGQTVLEGKVFKPSDPKVVTLQISAAYSGMIPTDLLGKSIEEAQAQLVEMGFRVELQQLPIEENMDEQGEYITPLGTVARSSVAPGEMYTQINGDQPSVIVLSYY